MVILIAGNVLDTLKSSLQYISKEELLNRIFDKLNNN